MAAMPLSSLMGQLAVEKPTPCRSVSRETHNPVSISRPSLLLVAFCLLAQKTEDGKEE